MTPLDTLRAENERLAAELECVTRERDEARKVVSYVTIQAQGWAMEARGHKSTVREAYQAVAGATGERGSWHGAQPIIEAFATLRAALATEREKVARLREAAKPFAEAGRSPPCAPGSNKLRESNIVECIAWSYRDGDKKHYKVMLTDFRTAARVYAETAPADGGGDG